jgi:uncharacterized protein YceH (UPF0502 family)
MLSTKLTDIEVRILGSLIEKEATTPDNYPLSLNALTNACNQLSNRDPVMALGEDAVRWAVNSLRQHSLVRAIQPSDSRVPKFLHLLRDKSQLEPPALAALCVLMLRGAQTPGEIKARSTRISEFASIGDVETTIAELVARALAVELPRQPGRKESRYAHALAGAPVENSLADARVHDGAIPTVETSGTDPRDARIAALEHSTTQLQRELAELRSRFEDFYRQFEPS